MKAHPVADIFPAMSDAEYQSLKQDIAEHGLREPIWTWRGMIIDGRHRFRACAEIGCECRGREFDGDESSLVAFVVSLNLKRRQLNESQLAFVALEAERVEADLAKRRQGARNDIKEVVPECSVGQARDKAAAIVGVSGRYVSDAKAIQRDAPELAVAIKAGAKTITQAKRELKERKREERRSENAAAVQRAPSPAVAVEQAKFATIVIDPPWDWGDEGDVDQLGRSRPTYETMSYEDLLSLPVGDRADIDCHLYLWITNRSLPKGFALLDAWGFRYVTCLTWCKPSFGMGNYFRGQSEQVLFGVRGSQMLKRKDVGTIFSAPRGPLGHSSKPLEFYSLVESCSPGPYLEMFARGERAGWVSWGAEIEPAA